MGISNSMKRRKVLKLTWAASGALSATGGIASGSGTENPDRLGVGEWFATSSGERIAVVDGTAKQSFVYRLQPDAPAVHGRPGTAYLFGEIRSSREEEPSATNRSEYRFVVDGQAYPTETHPDSVPHHKISPVYDDVPSVFKPDDDGVRLAQRVAGGIAAAVPRTGEVDSIGIGYAEDGETLDVVWEFDRTAVRNFNSDPSLRVADFEVDGPADLHDSTRATITVENSGDEGVFRALVGAARTTHPRAIEQTISADTRTDVTVPIRFPRAMSRSRTAELQPGRDLRFVLKPVGADPIDTTVVVGGDNR